MQAIKSVDIWAVSLNGFTVYCIYCGLTYFIPFLNQIYFLPATAVGMYGIINQYGLKMVGGPIGGFMSDKVHKSSAKHIRAGFVVCIIAMALFRRHISVTNRYARHLHNGKASQFRNVFQIL